MRKPEKRAAMLTAPERAPEHDLSGLTADGLAAVLSFRAVQCRRDRANAEARAAGRGGRIKLTSDESARLNDLICALVEAEHPMTVRSVFYRLVSFGVVEKAEQAYQRVDGRLTKLRESGRVDVTHLVDLSRSIHEPVTFADAAQALRWLELIYQRDLWADQDAKVWIGSEKDAISGVVQPITAELQVPLVVTHGYSSYSQISKVCESIDLTGKSVIFYQIGDHDPSGDNIPEVFQRRVREMIPDADVIFERLAVTPEQIAELDLPTRPTKDTDTRAQNWDGDESVEVDAIEPNRLREIVREAIERWIDQDRLEETREAEQEDKEQLSGLAA